MSEKNYHFPVPVKVYFEHRKIARVVLGKKAIIMRIPKGITKQAAIEIQEKFAEWAKKIIEEKNLYLNVSQIKDYLSLQSLQIMGENYSLDIDFVAGKKMSAILGNNNNIRCKIPNEFYGDAATCNEYISLLLRKVLPKYFTYKVWQRLCYWNDKYYQEEVPKLTLRYTTSRWGSCSRSGTISISMRLLLAPVEVLDYVLIHELSHRKEMNHSAKFWYWCAQAMPDHKEKELHLKEHGTQYII